MEIFQQSESARRKRMAEEKRAREAKMMGKYASILESMNKKNIDWGSVLLDLNQNDAGQLNAINTTLAGVTALAFAAGGPEVGAVVYYGTSKISTGISIILTIDTWGDYARLDNPQRGDLVKA